MGELPLGLRQTDQRLRPRNSKWGPGPPLSARFFVLRVTSLPRSLRSLLAEEVHKHSQLIDNKSMAERVGF